ncbi:AMP-binding enzyme [Candidatus Poriferisodalis sp.]|uniref:AMP-binding enzyme n=1 Tax=Candidatus Poriferisodalis sp. TaxID=3101277 RepID=UPI003B01B8D3
MIISGGENIYPAELEEVLSGTDLVAEASVVGLADERWGEVPVIVAVRASRGAGASDADIAAELLRLFDGRLARFKHPKAVFWADRLPRTALGKVRKHEVRAMLTENNGGHRAQ